MKIVTTFFSRWKPNIILIIVLSSIWLALTYYINFEKYDLLPPLEVFLKLGQGLIELIVFLILVKIIMASNAVLDSLDNLFQKVYFKRDFLKTLNHQQLVNISKDIHTADSSIIFDDEKKN